MAEEGLLQPQPRRPEPNERITAALAHAAVIIPYMGFIAPTLIWTTQKDKSTYAAFQALQATVYQLVMMMVWFIFLGCYMCSAIGNIPIQTSMYYYGNNLPEIFLLFFPLLMFGSILLFSLAWVIYGLAAAVMTLQGKDFRYVILGERIERFLESK